MGDRPTHAEIVRAAPIELPLYLVWRVAYFLASAKEYASEYTDAWREASAVQRRLTGAVVGAVALLVALIVFALHIVM